ncbi:MAG: hypothetical protein LAO31_12900 [Acidobacteriia bacterium]|nr:hypothetical protein [Terriglobia bacterium]
MSLSDKNGYDDQFLLQYLLGSLSNEEAERLDELSISDDEFALRLDSVENDLVDACVRGEPFGETLERFKAFYLSSLRRGEKVRFAETLRAFENRAAIAQLAPPTGLSSSQPSEDAWQQFFRRWFFPFQHLNPQWALAGVALVMLLASGLLLLNELRIRKQVAGAKADRAVLDERGQQLQTEITEQGSANAAASKESEQFREPQVNRDQLKTISMLLSPPTRGAIRVPTISVPAGTDRVELLLVLESDDFPTYRVVLKDPATNQILWRSTDLKTKSAGNNKAVSFGFRANLLKARNYLAELTGIPPGGTPDFISAYPFRVMLK